MILDFSSRATACSITQKVVRVVFGFTRQDELEGVIEARDDAHLWCGHI